MRPQIELALRRNGRKQAYLSVLLTGFLIVATTLAAYDHLHGRNSASMLIDIYADAVTLVQKVEDVGERRRLESRLKQLGESLERRRAQAAGA
jgi:hypothetical protein